LWQGAVLLFWFIIGESELPFWWPLQCRFSLKTASLFRINSARSGSPQPSKPLHQTEFEVSVTCSTINLQFIKFNYPCHVRHFTSKRLMLCFSALGMPILHSDAGSRAAQQLHSIASGIREVHNRINSRFDDRCKNPKTTSLFPFNSARSNFPKTVASGGVWSERTIK
jgi:hypothetical protein